MAGGIPSGSDPSGWEAGTVGSDPAQGYDPTAIAGAVVAGAPTVAGQLTGVTAGISNLVNRTQENVTVAYQGVVQNDPVMKGYSDSVFEGLNPDGTTPLTTLLLRKLAAAFGIDPSTTATNSAALTAIEAAYTALKGDASTASANFTTLLTDLSQSDSAALAAYIQAIRSDSSSAAGDWQTLLTTLSQADAAAFAAYTAAAKANALDAYNNWQTIFSSLGLSSSTAANLASWLSGAASGSMATKISSSAITSDNAQMLFNPDFSTAISIAGSGIWSWDGAVYYVPAGQTPVSPGSALVTANGALQGLTSTPSSAFPLGQSIVFSVQVLAQALTGSGTLLELFAIPWIGTVAQTPISIATSAAPAGATTGWTNAPTGSLATTMTGSWKPTTGSGITAVSMQLIVTGASNSGTVRWSAASMELTGGLISDLQADSAAKQAARQTYNAAVVAALSAGGGWATEIGAIDAARATYQATMADIDASQVVTLKSLFSALLGINSTTGKMSAVTVAGTTGSGTLADDWAKAVDSWDNIFGGGNDPTTSQVQHGALQSILGGADLGADVSTTSSAAAAAGAAATTAGTNAATAQATANATKTNLQTKIDVDTVLLDVLHLVYQKGSTGDTWGTVGSNGKPTYYSAYNEHQILKGVVDNASPPTDPAPTTGDVIAANTAASNTASTNASTAIASNQAVMNTLVSSQSGVAVTGVGVTDVGGAMTNIAQSSVQGLVAPNVTFGAVGSSATNHNGPVANNISLSGSHIPAATDTALYVVTVSVYAAPEGINSTSVTATINGTGYPMSLVSSIENIASSTPTGGFVLRQDTWRVSLTPTTSPGSISLAAALSAAGYLWFWMESFSYYGSKVMNSPTFASTTDATTVGSSPGPVMTAPASIASRRQLILAANLFYSGGGTQNTSGTPTLTSGSNALTSRWHPAFLQLGTHASNYYLYVGASDAQGGDASYNGGVGTVANGTSPFAQGVGTVLDLSN